MRLEGSFARLRTCEFLSRRGKEPEESPGAGKVSMRRAGPRTPL